MMTKLLYWIDQRVNLITVLLLFWAFFWLLNGGDKFLNGQQIPNLESWSAKGVLVNQAGEMAYTLHPIDTVGLYGVNRDAKMINYFKGIYLPAWLALFALYGIAVIEIILGLTFLALLVWCLQAEETQRKRPGLFANRTIHRLAFKGSILLFVLFSMGDTLFGDRTELWEHGTFIILCLITYDMWYRSDQFFLTQRREKTATVVNNPTSSIQAASYE